MKTIFMMAILFSAISAHAGTCDLVSGSFQTTTAECQYSIDGVNFYNEGHKAIKVAYSEPTHALTVNMNFSEGPKHAHTLNYLANGIEQVGRPAYEGDTYTASCENNHIHTRALMSALKYPLLGDFTATADGKMVYMQSLDGDSFVRVCRMERY